VGGLSKLSKIGDTWTT